MHLQKGVDINLTTNNGETPLLCAALNGHVDAISLLLSEGTVCFSSFLATHCKIMYKMCGRLGAVVKQIVEPLKEM